MNQPNVGRSVRVALAQRDRSMRWLAAKMGVTPVTASRYANTEKQSLAIIERLCDIFCLSYTDFIALGEKKPDIDMQETTQR